MKIKPRYLLDFSLYVTLILCSALVSCSTSSILLGKARTPTSSDSVRVYYNRPPAHYDEIALITSNNAGAVPMSSQSAHDTALRRLRAQSATLGANGVILEPLREYDHRKLFTLSGTAIYPKLVLFAT
jgi:hypothetical protein